MIWNCKKYKEKEKSSNDDNKIALFVYFAWHYFLKTSFQSADDGDCITDLHGLRRHDHRGDMAYVYEGIRGFLKAGEDIFVYVSSSCDQVNHSDFL